MAILMIVANTPSLTSFDTSAPLTARRRRFSPLPTAKQGVGHCVQISSIPQPATQYVEIIYTAYNKHLRHLQDFQQNNMLRNWRIICLNSPKTNNVNKEFDMKKSIVAGLLSGLLAISFAGTASADTIINNATNGYYNSSIGKVLDGTSSYFPVANSGAGDPTYNNMSPAPDLSNADAILGNWLSASPSFNSNWSLASIPSTWAINTETAIVYTINAGSTGLTNVLAQFGVDNGIYVWLDGEYLNGWMAPGGAGTSEYSLNIGSLSAGTHYMQILREDHGGATGYNINVSGDAAPVPEPGTMVLLGAGMLGLAVFGKRRMNKEA